MPVQKIKSGRVLNPGVNDFIGDRGIIFYDEAVGDLRLSDGSTPGGIPLALGGSGTYVLVTATSVRLGGIKVGSGLSITGDGTLSAIATSTYVLPTASTTTLGGIIVGSGLTIDGFGVLNAVSTSTSSYSLPIASTATLGGIKVGANLTIDVDGTLNANTSTAGVSDSFKTFKVSGESDLVAVGADTLEFIAGAGISIETSATSSPYKSMTITSLGFGNLDGGFPDSVYGGILALDGGGV